MNRYFSAFKHSPEGSREFQIYEYYTLPFDQYLLKYFSNVDLTGWYLLDKWAIEAETDPSNFIKNWCKGDKYSFDFVLFEASKEELTKFETLPKDLARIFAFLVGDHLFDSVEAMLKWINSRDWLTAPEPCNENCYSVLELLSIPQGDNYIRSKIPTLGHWKFK